MLRGYVIKRIRSFIQPVPINRLITSMKFRFSVPIATYLTLELTMAAYAKLILCLMYTEYMDNIP